MVSKIVEQHIACDQCGSSDAKCTYEDGHGYCFSCQYYTPPEGKLAPRELSSYTYEFLPWRGVTQDTFRFFNSKTKVDATGKPIAIGFEYPNSSYKVRYLDKKEFYTEGPISEAGLFGKDRFSSGSHKYVTITEGELDACSLWQVLKSPVVSVHSSSSAARDVTVDRSWVNDFERIYIAFDGDAAGKEAASRVARLFDYNKVYLVRFDKRKDANEYVAAGESDELRNIWWNSKRYLPEAIVSSFSDFEKILKEEKKIGVPYPFPTLTGMTYGIRTGESVLITAQEGVGKTAVMHAIEHQILTRTSDNVGSIFLEEPKRDHLQALASIELRKPVHLPDSGVSDDDALAGLKKIVGLDERLHVYTHFGSDDPEVLLDHIRFLVSARGCRYILLDHITMAVSGLAGEKIRLALDYFCTRLEMMVVELDFALIFVSHVNDDDQPRDSRMAAKVANTRIHLYRDHMNPNEKTANTTKIMLFKNRFGQKTGAAGEIFFDTKTCTYSELDGDGNVQVQQGQSWLQDSGNVDLPFHQSPSIQREGEKEERDEVNSKREVEVA